MDETGRCVGLLGLQAVQLPGDTKEVLMNIIQWIAEKINA